MKKLVLLMALISFFAIGLYAQIVPDTSIVNEIQRNRTHQKKAGQMTDTEIWKIIHMSKEANLANGITNPDSIYVGQTFTFQVMDGADTTITVNQGDTEWDIIAKLGPMVKKHGPVVNYSPNKPFKPVLQHARTKAVLDEKPVTPEKKVSGWSFWDLFAGILLVLLIFLIWFFLKKKWRGRYSENPATEGKPFVPGGVRPENAEDHFRKLAIRENPNANIRIKDQKPGFLSTPGGKSAAVEFVDGTFEDLQFRNRPGFSGMVSLNGGKTFNEEFYLSECGNPVYQRKSLKKYSGIIFSETPIDFLDEPTAPAPKSASAEPIIPAIETTAVPEKEAPRSEYDTQIETAMDLAEKVLTKENPYEVTIKIPKGEEGTFELTFKAQYPKKEGK